MLSNKRFVPSHSQGTGGGDGTGGGGDGDGGGGDGGGGGNDGCGKAGGKKGSGGGDDGGAATIMVGADSTVMPSAAEAASAVPRVEASLVFI